MAKDSIHKRVAIKVLKSSSNDDEEDSDSESELKIFHCLHNM